MSGQVEERLYNLMPAVYRLRDVEQGEPLRALLAVIEAELQRLDENVETLYEDWFIETCQEWVVPYIGDLLGVSGLAPVQEGAFTQRAFVANTLAYRRAKGTAAVLEQLSRDVTGWPARAVEFFQRLATTQYMNHVRLDSPATLDVRDADHLQLVNGPFERAAHTADVRHIDHGRGKYNIPNVGIFLWRLGSYYVHRSTARAVASPGDGRYVFSPLGDDIPLFNRPRTEATITQLAGEINVPGPLRRLPLHKELEAWRQAIVDGKTPVRVYFGTRPVLRVFWRMNASDPMEEIPAEEIVICNLADPDSPAPPPTDWRRPTTSKTYVRAGNGVEVQRDIQVAVDPVSGRLSFPNGVLPERVEVSYAYGFSGDLGGGPYNRQASVESWLDLENPLARRVTWQRGVTQDEVTLAEAQDPALLVETLADAINQWNTHAAANPTAFGLIAVMDSATYADPLPDIELPAGSRLAIVAADWPQVALPGAAPGVEQRIVGEIVPDGRRPHVLADIGVEGTAAADSANPGELVLDGLLIEGDVRVRSGNLGTLHLAQATVVPGRGEIVVEGGNGRLGVVLSRVIGGRISLPDTVMSLTLEDCIIDGQGGPAIAAPGSSLELEACTLFGGLSANRLEASNCIFTAPISVTRRQEGCVRFSSLPSGSSTPRRHRCQPDLAVQQALAAAREANPAITAAEEVQIADGVRIRVKPSFTSVHYGHPGYGQLSRAAAIEIHTGADDEGEMGAFNFLQQPQRLANLQNNLNEYLRFGLEAGIFFVN